MTRSEKPIESTKTQAITAALEEIKVTPVELAEMLIQNPNFELSADKKLVIYDMNVNDFLTAIAATDQPKRLQVFFQMMNRLSLDINLEGSVALGEFNIGDHSWALSAGNSGSLKIQSKPATVVKSLGEIVSFLNLMATGKGFPLKARQDLLLTGLSSDSMLDYYRLCQESEEASVREKGQDDLFTKACQTLGLKGLSLKVYGLNASQVDRNIDVNAGGILFKATGNNDGTNPHLILALLDKTAS